SPAEARRSAGKPSGRPVPPPHPALHPHDQPRPCPDPAADAPHAEDAGMSGLKGLTVLEIADTLGAAFAGSLLADYNATVIVCEPPEGSKLRRLGPAALDETRWKILARNKQSVAADWATST